MEYYRDHDNEAEEIARNSYETFARRYLTPAAVSVLRSNISTCRLTIDRLRATGDDSSGPGLRCKAMSQSCIHPTSTAIWSCEQHHGQHSQPTGPMILRLSLRHLNRLAGFKFQKTTISRRQLDDTQTIRQINPTLQISIYERGKENEVHHLALRMRTAQEDWIKVSFVAYHSQT
jgi:hypothetical protein